MDCNETCGCEPATEHEELIATVENDLPEDEVLYDLAELFKMFADSTRVKILYVLLESELCVYDIAKVLNVTQSAVSHQLRILKSGKLIKYRREGKNMVYSLADEHVRTMIEVGMEHISE